MKNKQIVIVSILFFLFVNTSYFWVKLPGLWDIALTGILFLGFLILSIVLIIQIIKLIKSKFSVQIALNCITLLSVLVLTVLFPLGIIDFKKLEGANLILAQYEGVANCTTTLKIKDKNRFIYESICFGIDDYKGDYKIVGDTIKLTYDKKSSFDSKFAYAIIKLDSIKTYQRKGMILFYRHLKDKNPLPMKILEFDIK